MTSTKPVILVADDEANIRLMLRTTLESGGCTVLEAVDGLSAMRMIVDEEPAVIVLDLWMPHMDGLAVMQVLRNRVGIRKPRVIVLTAHGSVPLVVKAIRLGASDFLDKPVSPDDLRLSVAAALEEEREVPIPDRDPGDGDILSLVRRELWRHNYHAAEVLLNQAAERASRDPAYFNLLGVLHEAEGRPRLAKKFYVKAVKADGEYEPARRNLMRLDELEAYGRTTRRVSLGIEGDLLDSFLGRAAVSELDVLRNRRGE
jgi:DNA-binding response OmpR family regulator